MHFFDTHTHLDYVQQVTQENLAQLIHNAHRIGVEKMLIVAVLRRDFENIVNMTALYPTQLYYGLGLHPLYIEQHSKNDLDILSQALEQGSAACTAIAEIGLERGKSDLISEKLWKKQCEFLEVQLSFAQRFNLPVSLHSRQSHDHLFTFLKRIKVNKCGVIHGFAGSYDQAKRFVDLGYKIGVGGTITYERANKTRNTIAKLPLDSLLLETDSPDMPICGFQGQPNRSERIIHVFHELCQLRKEPAELIASTIWKNSCNLFAK